MGTSTPTKILIEIKCVNENVTVEPQSSEGFPKTEVTHEGKIKVEVFFNDKKKKGAGGAPKDADSSKTAGINVTVNGVPMEPAASYRSKSEDQSGATAKPKEAQTPSAEDTAGQAGAKEEEKDKKDDTQEEEKDENDGKQEEAAKLDPNDDNQEAGGTQEEAAKLDPNDDKQEAGGTQQQSSGQDADMADQSPPKKMKCGFADGTETVRPCGGNLIVSSIVPLRRQSVLKSSVEGKKVISEGVLKVIRRKLYEFYAFKEEPPTLEKLQQALKKEINFVCSRKTLFKALRADGYRIGHDQELIKMPRNYTVPDNSKL